MASPGWTRMWRLVAAIAVTGGFCAFARAQDSQQEPAGYQPLEEAIAEGRLEDAMAILDGLYEQYGPDVATDTLRARMRNRLTRHAEAQAVLEQVMREKPEAVESGDVQYELGVAYYWQQRYVDAERALTRAIELSAQQTADAREMRGWARTRLGLFEDAREDFAAVLANSDPGQPAYQNAQQWREQLTSPVIGDDRRYGAQVSWGLGYSSNVSRLGTDTQLPGGVSGNESVYTDLRVRGWYDLYRDEDTRVRLSASPNLRRYFDAQSFSYFSGDLDLEATHQWTPQLRVGAGLGYAVTWLQDPTRKYLRTISPRLFGAYEWSARTSSTLLVSFSDDDYYLSGLSGVRNPDGQRFTVRAQQLIWLDSDQRWSLHLGLGHTINDARGSDWDYRSMDASAALTFHASERWRITAGVYAASYDYLHANSFTTTGRDRSDTIVSGFATVQGRITDWIGIHAGYVYSDARSNIEAFDYDVGEWFVTPYIDLFALLGSAGGGGDSQ